MKLKIPVFTMTRVELETNQGHKLGGFLISFNPKTNEVQIELDLKGRNAFIEIGVKKD